ncbi:MAG: hypothetical protein IKN58_09780 [Prevotella sp.]|jgi:hypothetical protein|nr:hypothetical protein [Prevotella sp.]
MSNILRIRTLTDRFLEGETTLEEERELYAFYRSEEVPDDLLSLRPLFVGLEEIQLETPSITPKKKKGDWRKWVMIAASVLVLFLLGGSFLWQQQQNECVAYVYGERVTDRDLIMQELERSIGTMTEGQNDIENQLNDMFNIN